MALIENWYPPSKEKYDLLLFLWFFFPVVCFHSTPLPLTNLEEDILWLTHKSEQRDSVSYAVVWHGQDVRG